MSLSSDPGCPAAGVHSNSGSDLNGNQHRQIAHSLNAPIWMLYDPDDWAEFKHAPEFYE